ncbi:hypothetical protein QE152_g8822 [Popillia japonica]|uniref:Uncharacterized protein n=1 Tax=Popillia japonica TaxID=7064 RepID=A0AAW1M0R1_POPJA
MEGHPRQVEKKRYLIILYIHHDNQLPNSSSKHCSSRDVLNSKELSPLEKVLQSTSYDTYANSSPTNCIRRCLGGCNYCQDNKTSGIVQLIVYADVLEVVITARTTKLLESTAETCLPNVIERIQEKTFETSTYKTGAVLLVGRPRLACPM